MRGWLLCFFLGGFVFSCLRNEQKIYQEAVNFLLKEDIKSLNQAVKKYDETIRYTLLALDGKYKAYKVLGMKLLEHKMYLEASKAFNLARKIDPTGPNIHYYLGLCYANYAEVIFDERRKYIDLAEKAYQAGLKQDKNNAIIYYALGVLTGFLKKDLDEGIRLLEIAKTKEPNDLSILFACANLYYQKGFKEIARGYYQKIMQIAPKKSEKWQKAKSNLEDLF